MMETQKKETKNKITKFSKWLLGVIVAGLISVGINSLATKINFWESTKKIAFFLFQADIGLLILILILFGIVYSLHQKNKNLSDFQKKLSDTNIKEILSNNERFIKINDELRESANNLIDKYKNIKNEIKEEIKAKLPKEEKELQLTKDQLFILALIAESNEVSFNSLSESYREQFPEANPIEIKYITNLLRENGLIRRTGNIRGNLFYGATDKGIERVRKESEIIKEYRKAIEERKEMSKMAKKF